MTRYRFNALMPVIHDFDESNTLMMMWIETKKKTFMHRLNHPPESLMSVGSLNDYVMLFTLVLDANPTVRLGHELSDSMITYEVTSCCA